MRIFVTGASGCIGHYIAETLIKESEHELFFLVRNPSKLKFDFLSRSGVEVLQGDLQEIEKFSDLLKTIDVAILAATSWGGTQESYEINVNKTLNLINLLAPEVCQQVIYFSTASILDRQNQLLKEAGELGTDYIRTKYQCYNQLQNSPLANKVTVLFPTLVFGGDKDKPYSHLSQGMQEVLKWINLAKWLQADGSFHFIHARDIAQVVKYLVANPTEVKQLVLGNAPLTVNQALEETCSYLDKKIYWRFPLSFWLANILIKVFRIQVAPWDRFCMEYRHFVYSNAANPASFGLNNYCSTLTDILQLYES